jgi:sulfatase modifying factor 1
MMSMVMVAAVLGGLAASPADPTTAAAATSTATERIPAGMVKVPAGTFRRGRTVGSQDQQPPHQVSISAFFFDETLVTVADFRRHVEQTGYVTSAERLGYGKTAVLGMRDWQWQEVRGANWRSPFGSAYADIIVITDDMPVTMVSWRDADAYCRAHGKRLPTEAEWEYAMRAGATTRYPWGDTLHDATGAVRFNHWEGTTHADNAAADHADNTAVGDDDGFVYLSPVRAYPPNGFGLYDAVGNVWQWTADWYAKDTFARTAEAAHTVIVTDPTGPASGEHKVARGGSWWCSAGTCHGFGLVTRGKTLPTAPFSNNGFRCALDLPPSPSSTATPPAPAPGGP